MTKRPKLYDVGGIQLEIGPPISAGGGLVFVARAIQDSTWLQTLVPALRQVIAAFEGQR